MTQNLFSNSNVFGGASDPFDEFLGSNRAQNPFSSIDEMLEEFQRHFPASGSSFGTARFGPGIDPDPHGDIYISQCINKQSFHTFEEWEDQQLPLSVFVLPVPNQENNFHVFSEAEVDALIRSRHHTNPYTRDQGLPSRKEDWWKRTLRPSPEQHGTEETFYSPTHSDDESPSRFLEEEKDHEEQRKKEQKINDIIDKIGVKRCAQEELEKLSEENSKEKERLE